MPNIRPFLNADCCGANSPPCPSRTGSNLLGEKLLPADYLGRTSCFSTVEIRKWIQEKCTTVAEGSPSTLLRSWRYEMDWSTMSPQSAYPGLWGIWPSGCTPKDTVATSRVLLQLCRCMACRLKAGFSRIGGRMHHKWTFGSSIGVPINGIPLQPNEVEVLVHTSQDWTNHWGWAITLRAHSSNASLSSCSWRIDIRILVKDLPRLLKSRDVFWGNGQSEPDLEQSWSKDNSQFHLHAFSAPGKTKSLNTRGWVAEVYIQHSEKECQQQQDFRDLLSADAVIM